MDLKTEAADKLQRVAALMADLERAARKHGYSLEAPDAGGVVDLDSRVVVSLAWTDAQPLPEAPANINVTINVTASGGTVDVESIREKIREQAQRQRSWGEC